MGTASYVPAADPDFYRFANNFVTYGSSNAVALGTVAADWNPLATLMTSFAAAYTAAKNPSTKTKNTVATKDLQRALLTAALRPMAQKISVNPAVTPASKLALGVNPRNALPTPVPTPISAPVLSLQNASHLQHVLRYRDDQAPAGVRAKASGAVGLQLFGGVSAVVPQDASTLPLLGTYTKVPIVVAQQPGNVGSTMYYSARWVTRTGQVGPFSPIIPIVVL